ncbi:hypothetical protein [Flavobacterium caseinilyticum]|uniref:Uncharacterized protein n=1 Tax=Flavobacterium caseinilyticum TaxID=2541732 RepID=A0A4R5AP40_9FLAO|nr:hypothetical protein [Flavobacterium caseinilyticum]TDD74403.1 hypothetical protein E0F89_14995 [Flavobacterium caseinilyticum]
MISKEVKLSFSNINITAYSLFSLLENHLKWFQMQNRSIKINPVTSKRTDKIFFILQTVRTRLLEKYNGKVKACIRDGGEEPI